MSGYVASSRIERGSARLTHPWADRRTGDGAERAPAATSAIWVESGTDTAPSPIAVRWTAFRERWSQLTFYLFDPDSWR